MTQLSSLGIIFAAPKSSKPRIPGLNKLAGWVRREELYGGGSSAEYRADRQENNSFRITRLDYDRPTQFLAVAKTQAHAQRLLDFYVANDLTIRRLLSGKAVANWSDFFEFNLYAIQSTLLPG